MIAYVYIGEIAQLQLINYVSDPTGEINEAGGVLTFFIPAKTVD